MLTAIPPGKIKLTREDLAAMPQDGKRYEIMEGELYVTPSPSLQHQRITAKLERMLARLLDDSGLGEVYFSPADVVFDEENVVQPDIFFIRSQRLDIIHQNFVKGPPDLVVEVLSPGTKHRDLKIKSALYARFGVPIYWVVDPLAHWIEVYLLENHAFRSVGRFGENDTIELEGLPGFRLENIFS